MYFETHAHYDDEQFDSDRETLLNRLPNCGIDIVVNSASDMKSSYEGIALAEKYSYIYAAVGVHPHETYKMKQEDLESIRRLSSHKKVVAVGEIGLDYHYDNTSKEIQKKWFSQQLTLAKEVKLPVIIHSREAAQDCFTMIKESGIKKGVIHCYSGSLEMALDYIAMGFYIGIGGVVTYQNAKKLVEVAQNIPLERIVIETDSPYLSPVPYRGKRNDSTNLTFIVEKLSSIRKISTQEVSTVTKYNAEQLFFK